MSARRLYPHDLMSEAELAGLRRKSSWKGIALIVHAWVVIAASMALFVLWPNPLGFVLAVLLIGSRQLGLAILMHDGAHGCLSPSPKWNLRLSQWFCAYPVFAETTAYRQYHLQHHARTQQPDDPDLVLSAPFPITRASYWRKFWRDLSGRTGFSQRKAQWLHALGDPAWPLAKRARHFWERLGPQCVANAVLWLVLAALGIWWAYPLLWLLPLLTWMMVISRVRNIAEHAVVPDNDDPLRNTRTTYANWIERLFIAPYYVNYHLEHHVLLNVPCYHLPRAHRILSSGPLGARMEVQPGYLAVMRMATSRPPDQDRRGELASPVRRARAGARVDDNQASSGF